MMFASLGTLICQAYGQHVVEQSAGMTGRSSVALSLWLAGAHPTRLAVRGARVSSRTPQSTFPEPTGMLVSRVHVRNNTYGTGLSPRFLVILVSLVPAFGYKKTYLLVIPKIGDLFFTCYLLNYYLLLLY